MGFLTAQYGRRATLVDSMQVVVVLTETVEVKIVPSKAQNLISLLFGGVALVFLKSFDVLRGPILSSTALMCSNTRLSLLSTLMLKIVRSCYNG